MKRVIFTRTAEQEFEDIGNYIALSNPARAVSFIQELRQKCFGLVDMPKRYPLLVRYRSTGIRRYVNGDYLVFYRISGETIEVIHVLHGAMDYEQILFPKH